MAALPRARATCCLSLAATTFACRGGRSQRSLRWMLLPLFALQRHRPLGRRRRPSTACETSGQTGAAMRLYCACIAGACPPAVRGDINSRNGHGLRSCGRVPRPADSACGFHHAIPDEGLTRGDRRRLAQLARAAENRIGFPAHAGPDAGGTKRRPVIFPRARGTRRRNGWACILLIGAYRAPLSLTQAGSGPETCIGRPASLYVDELKTTLTQRPVRVAPDRRK